MKTIISITFIAFLLSCSASRKASVPKNFPSFYKEGHRGTRGLMPENTIPSMTKAIEAGANFIEIDIYITKDGQVMVAHDPYVNVGYSLDRNGNEIPKEAAKQYVWRQMNYEDIRQIDVGSKQNKDFPQQQTVKTYMPLLGELIDSVEAYTSRNNLPGIIYNIEVKTSRRFDSLGYNADPVEMIRKVMDVVRSKNIGNRFYIQSFDKGPLQVLRNEFRNVTIGFLTGDRTKSIEDNLRELGFAPDIYSPHYSLVTKEMADYCKAHNMKLVPWTVNTVAEMKKLIDIGVDGIITDYPNYFKELGL